MLTCPVTRGTKVIDPQKRIIHSGPRILEDGISGNVTPPDTPLRLRGYNYNLSSCYPRRMADFNRNDMLFSSGDSPKLLNDPLGGWAR
jgi:hypothetical protein